MVRHDRVRSRFEWRVLAAAVAGALSVAAVHGVASAAQKSQPPSTADRIVRCFDVAVDGSDVYLALTSGLGVWDLSDLARPQERHREIVPADVLGVALDLPRIWLAAGTRGLYLAEFDDDGRPQAERSFDTPGTVRQVVVAGDHLLLADDRYGLRVLDVSAPHRPRQIARVTTRDRVRSLALRGVLLAVAEDRAGVRIFDLTKPGAPLERYALRDEERALDVAWTDNALLVAAAGEGLVAYALDASGAPSRAGFLKFDGPAEFIGARPDGLALVATGSPRLPIVDVSDPHAPRLLATPTLHRAAAARRIVLHGDRAYVALETAFLAVLDVADPSEPLVLLPRERKLEVSFPGWDEFEQRRRR